MKRVLRIGLGRSKSGKILDRDTKWLNLNNREDWNYAIKECNGKPLFLSENGRAYKEISMMQLLELCTEFN